MYIDIDAHSTSVDVLINLGAEQTDKCDSIHPSETHFQSLLRHFGLTCTEHVVASDSLTFIKRSSASTLQSVVRLPVGGFPNHGVGEGAIPPGRGHPQSAFAICNCH